MRGRTSQSFPFDSAQTSPRQKEVTMFTYTEMIYLAMKLFLFFSIVGVLLKAEPMRNQLFALSFVYTLACAFLSYVFMVLLGDTALWGNSWKLWWIWAGSTFVLSWLYFKLLIWFEDNSLFWFMLMLGIPFCLDMWFHLSLYVLGMLFALLSRFFPAVFQFALISVL